MPELPLISVDMVIAVFAEFGWILARRESSHLTLKKPGVFYCLTITNKREVPRGTLRQSIHKAGLTAEEFLAAWERIK